MKTKLTLFVAAYMFPLSVTLAQTNTFPTTGSAGIGTISPTVAIGLLIYQREELS